MLKHPQLTLQRVQQFASPRGLARQIYLDRQPVQLSVFHAPDRIPYAQAAQGNYVPTQIGEKFGPFWSTHWFKVELEIPAEWAGKEVHLLWDSSSEAEIYENGRPVQGLAGSGGGWGPGGAPVRAQFPLARPASGGEKRTLYVEMAVNHFFGLGSEPNPFLLNQVGILRTAEIAVFDRAAWDLFWDLKIIADMAQELPAGSPRGAQALFAANKMVNLVQLDDPSTWPAARQVAAEFFSARTGEGQLDLSAIGHAHIDTAWLWPLAETRRKTVRTFSSAMRYMDEYPDYKFACSQAQQLEWIKEEHPGLYAEIKEKVRAGQFIPVGGSWVEPDCNLPSGEALVRQFLYGQRFFQREFGATCNEFWEPDVFGYTAALPQILRLSGMDHFLTIKLSWNQFNKLSSHTFWWEGLDGSKVLTHFPPADDYNAMANVKVVLYSQTNYKDLDRSKNAYMLFGFGDGGGGPTVEMLEQLQRMKDVDGLPRVEMRTADDFFTRLEGEGKDLTTWVGELYFELHRGTYTTQANNKKYNRRSEFLLHDIEFLSAVARATRGLDYPKAELDRLWKMVLTNQFHDIIPGSSINLVYRDSAEHYAAILASGAKMRAQAVEALTASPGAATNLCAINTTSSERSEVVELPSGLGGLQSSADGKALGVASVPAYGYAVVSPSQPVARKVTVGQQGGQIILENELVRAVFTSDGGLVSLFDKAAGKEGIEPGSTGNRFVIFDDNPNQWEAWDVDIFHLEKPLLTAAAKNCRVIEEGPLRAAIAFDYQVSPETSISQVVQLTALSARLDFKTEVDWHERRKFLKVEFPLNVRAMNATYEIQFGHLQRPTHFNTSWDWARFEVPAHRWADLSDPQFGVALLNDSKYGYATHGNVMRLSLLRGPLAPDPDADQGTHQFTYALLPHAGGPQFAGVIEEGYNLNAPLLLSATAAAPARRSYFWVSNPALIIDTVKKAEDSEDIVVRMYEARGTRGSASLHTSLPVAKIQRVNLLEDALSEPVDAPTADGVQFSFRPFELVSFKISLK